MTNKLKHSQNFFKSKILVRKLIEQSNIDDNDIVYEIGAGKGIITKELCKVCSQVIAIEYDRELHQGLIQKLNHYENIELIFGDFLNINLPAKGKFKIFSNIPFNITAKILSKITSLDNSPEESYLIIQEEAAKRYSGLPYNKESLNSLMIKPFFELSIINKLKNTDFIPIPNVNIVFLRIKKREKYLLEINSYKTYSDFVSYVFSQTGKELKQRLKKIFTHNQFKRLSKNLQFNIDARTIDLTLEQWIVLFKYYITGVSKDKKLLVKNSSIKLLFKQKNLDKKYKSRNK